MPLLRKVEHFYGDGQQGIDLSSEFYVQYKNFEVRATFNFLKLKVQCKPKPEWKSYTVFFDGKIKANGEKNVFCSMGFHLRLS